MRILFYSLLYSLFFITRPLAVHAAEGPAGHHHDHDMKEKQHNHTSEHRSTLMGSDNDAHGHGAHNWPVPEEEQNRPNPIAASAQSISTGKQLFRHYCISCHGFNADGDSMRGQNLSPKAANLRAMAGHHTDGDYHYKIRTGRGPMPHWEKTISHENIWHLVNYLQSLKPEKASTKVHDHHPKPEPAPDKHNHHDQSTHKH